MVLRAKKHILSLCLVLLAFSCSPRHTLNAIFEEKYGKEIESINASRAVPVVAPQDLNRKLSFAPHVPEDINPKTDERYVSHEQYYANVDAVEYRNIEPRETFPDQNVFVQGKNSETLPENMFQISYYTHLSPPFSRTGTEFDRIKIPQKDAYGIVTAASHKQYFLVGNKSLQDNVDGIRASRSQEDIHHSEQLINENKIIRRRLKNIKAFGKDYAGIAPPVIMVQDGKEEEMVEPEETTEAQDEEQAPSDTAEEVVQDAADNPQETQEQAAITPNPVKEPETVFNKDNSANDVK